MAFNRDRNNRSGGDRGGFRSRPSFGDRPRFGDRGPVEMHQAVCDNCRKECEVPFRPTSGKPVFCSSCFEGSRGSDSRGSGGRNFERPANFEEKRMFEATCDECRNACRVPFQPSGDKPVYCSNCFGEKKGAGSNGNGQPQPQFKEQFEALNNKIDRILQLLDPQPQESQEPVVAAVEETKVVKKRSPKKS